MTGDECTVDLEAAESCDYAGSQCFCNGYIAGAGGAGGAGGDTPGLWTCHGAGDDCPDTAPMSDDDCDNPGDFCPYPDGVSCSCGGQGWNCIDPNQGIGGAGNEPDACPETVPDGDCNGPVSGCFYDDTDELCSCPAGANAEWDCLDLTP
jgi:hypothetical protein